VNGLRESLPPVELLVEDLAASASEAVITSTPLSRFLDPAALDPAAALEPIEKRVE
jgi:hypothetical protein